MDDARTTFFRSSLATLTFLVGIAAHGIQLEYIEPAEVTRLAAEFDQAELRPEQYPDLAGQHWTCDIYGVRTRLQVQRGLRLYQLHKEPSQQWSNSGAQVIATYQVEGNHLVGRKGALRDLIKMNGKGNLISKLVLDQDKSQTLTLAYSLCRKS